MSRPLRPFQAEALSLLQDTSVHLVLTAPTGSGKGVILEELAQDPDERIVLITPLIALARQQARRFNKNEIPHHSSVGRGPVIDPGPAPGDRIWILSPESAILPKRIDEIRRWRPTLIAVDEAHCLEEWGESFRPAYGSLIKWVNTLKVNRTLWMSATFPRSLAHRLESEIPGNWRTLGSFRLPDSLSITIERCMYSERIEEVRNRLLRRNSPGILFTGTRKASEKYAQLFQNEGIVLIPYHAGMSDEERRAVESLLEKGPPGSRSPSVSATNAFGMGMDFPQLEWTLLSQTPLSILSLMQAFGRVGRSGRVGMAEILWAEEDFRIAGYLVSGSSHRERSEERLRTLRSYLEETAENRAEILSDFFV